MSAGADSASAVFCITQHLVNTRLGLKYMRLAYTALLILPYKQILDNSMGANSPQCCTAMWRTRTCAQSSTAGIGVVRGMW